MIKQVGLTPGQFRDDNTYISYAKMAELLETAAYICERPDFGLLLACQQSNEVLGELPAIAAQSATVGAALDSVDKVLYLHARGVHLKQLPGLRTTRISLQFDFSSPMGISQLIQMSVGHLASFTAELMNADRTLFPCYFRQPMKRLSSADNHYYRHLNFAENFDGIVVDNLSLTSRNHQNRDTIKKHFDRYLKDLQLQYPDSLEKQAIDVMGKLLPTGECSLDKVAGTLDMHPRSFQKRLQHNKLSYSKMLRETRQSLAERHLRDQSMTVTELALSLGFSDVSAFSRCFKHWTGQSPKQWQEVARKTR